MTEDSRNPNLSPEPNPDKGKPNIPSQANNHAKKPGRLNWIINKESKFGRFNRNLIRGLGWAAIIFTLGFFSVYYLLYNPLLEENERVSQTNHNTQLELKTAQAALNATAGTTTQQSTLTVNQRLLPAAMIDVNQQVLQIELALAKRDSAGAADQLKKLQETFTTFVPEVQQVDPDLANLLDTRLKLVSVEAARDPKTAQNDLQVITGYLQDLVLKISQ